MAKLINLLEKHLTKRPVNQDFISLDKIFETSSQYVTSIKKGHGSWVDVKWGLEYRNKGTMFGYFSQTDRDWRWLSIFHVEKGVSTTNRVCWDGSSLFRALLNTTGRTQGFAMWAIILVFCFISLFRKQSFIL